MEPVDAFLREIQGGALLESRDLNDRRRHSLSVQQLSTYHQSQGLMHAQHLAYSQPSVYPQHHGRVHQSSGYIEPQVDDQAEVPLDAFG